ncbi:hypothetical protein EW146_g7451 [Bondarzewia mesenterica]|uniref:ATP-dependent DNA helicase n=1 Tax=Bondarzewia mesenterica TaxID=1095465 RepID=A0A4S4LRE4_9AGAM|nr:hypothetical protein EW146_g7451 [Bondarzewia mesenterica]
MAATDAHYAGANADRPSVSEGIRLQTVIKIRFPRSCHNARGMRGTVSTYEQDLKGISRMTDGRLMPRPPAILASVISITVVGRGRLPKDWLKSTFKVRRFVVREALVWLKTHNPKYYGDIEIDEGRLNMLPVDDIPDELTATVRQSEDVSSVEEESAGYVPREDAELEDDNHDEQSRPWHGDHGGTGVEDLASVIPLKVSGAIDTDLNSVSANDFMLTAMSNLWRDGEEGGYAVRHGFSCSGFGLISLSTLELNLVNNSQIFAGHEIDMDAFITTNGPDKTARAQTIAQDPYAAARFFHFIIGTVFETLFNIHVVENSRVESGMGVLGEIAAYFGTVESQGRGTLHLHLLLWLQHAPSMDEMQDLLKTDTFCLRVKQYISDNLHAYLPGMDSQMSMSMMENEKEIGYGRPPNPEADDYEEQLRQWELRVARSKQVHKCEPRRCLYRDDKGRYVCKRGAPFPLADEDFIDEVGNWGMKRKYDKINGWVPAITINLRCNNDGKLLTNGSDMKNIAWYVTGYAAKKQNKNHNMSALIAKGYAFHTDRNDYRDSLQDQQRKLIFRVLQTANLQQELAAPMVISYLMGWGDTFKSHHYVPTFWSSFSRALRNKFPELRSGRHLNGDRQPQNAEEEAENVFSATTRESDEHVATNVEASIEAAPLCSDGRLCTRCQLMDYAYRGDDLDACNVIEFFSNTYERFKSNDCVAVDDAQDVVNDYSAYRAGHPRSTNIHRVVQKPGHNTLPNFIGGYSIPRKDNPEIYAYYCACMLILFKPWRTLGADLKSPAEDWPSAFEAFVSHTDPATKRKINGFQYYHDCLSAAVQNKCHHHDTVEEEEIEMDMESANISQENVYTEDELQQMLSASCAPREKMYAEVAIAHAYESGIFSTGQDSRMREKAGDSHGISHTNAQNIEQLASWKQQMEMSIAQQNISSPVSQSLSGRGSRQVNPMVEPLLPIIMDMSNASDGIIEDALSPANPDQLTEDQRRAFDIIVGHLDQTLAGQKPEPLRMIISGEGGTGKSKVIQSITEAFNRRGASNMLAKGAYTGVAASLITGKTTHTLCMLSQRMEKMSQETKMRLEQEWDSRQYLIVDEYSMISKTLLSQLSRRINIAKKCPPMNGLSFGGVSVILCGDHHQFPSVAAGSKETLYWPVQGGDTLERISGKEIFSEFENVVKLTQQMRVTDPVWREFLQNLRYGRVQEDDLQMLRGQILNTPSCPITDFTTSPWNTASLVTPRHAVRTRWNSEATAKHCKQTGMIRFFCPAEDKIKSGGPRHLSIGEHCEVAKRSLHTTKRRDQRKDLPNEIELSVGMKVMVTTNLETDLDITNGARGDIVHIALHPDEPSIGTTDTIHLEYLPIYILVHLDRTRTAQLDGLDERVIPIEPSQQTFTIVNPSLNPKPKILTVTRCQLPITAAYAFTDYRAQGQTIPYVVVDIAPPPNGTLSLFNLYVALSRSSGRDIPHDPAVLEEDDRLDNLNEKTRKKVEFDACVCRGISRETKA